MMQKFSKVAAGEEGEESVVGEPVKKKKFKVVDHGRSEYVNNIYQSRFRPILFSYKVSYHNPHCFD